MHNICIINWYILPGCFAIVSVNLLKKWLSESFCDLAYKNLMHYAYEHMIISAFVSESVAASYWDLRAFTWFIRYAVLIQSFQLGIDLFLMEFQDFSPQSSRNNCCITFSISHLNSTWNLSLLIVSLHVERFPKKWEMEAKKKVT